VGRLMHAFHEGLALPSLVGVSRLAFSFVQLLYLLLSFLCLWLIKFTLSTILPFRL